MKKIEREDLPTYIKPGVLNPERLALVHVTKYLPIGVGDHFEIPSTAIATDFLHTRNTVHFTIGHHVSSHLGGNWDLSPIMIVACMKDTIDLNEKPLCMSSMDTYFETYLEKRLILPKDAHIFMPADNPSDLNGRLLKTEGNKTIYKASNYTDDEKREICERSLLFENVPFLHDADSRKITQENCTQASDEFFVFHLKENMLFIFLEKNGYLSDDWLKFSKEGSFGADGVCALGEHLGCRFYSSGNKMHYFCNFDPSIIGNLYHMMSVSDFIFNSDDYSVVGRDSNYSFIKKGMKKELNINEYDLKSTIAFLKRKLDYSKVLDELEKEAGIKKEDALEKSKGWTPAYRATFHVWKEKTLARLSGYYNQAKTFDFDGWRKNLNERISAYKALSSQKEKSAEVDENSKEIKKNILPPSVLCDNSR